MAALAYDMSEAPSRTTAWVIVTACCAAIPLFAHEYPPLTAEQVEAVTPVIHRLADALEALRDRYAEFNGVQADKIIRATKTGIGVGFTRNFSRPTTKRGIRADDWGMHGISVTFGCTRPFVPDGDHIYASSARLPPHKLERLGLELSYEVLVSPRPSPGVREEVLRILKKHVQLLSAIDEENSQPAASMGG